MQFNLVHLFKLVTRDYFKYVKYLFIFLSLVPFLILSWQFYTEQLGINPLAYLTKVTGHLVIIFLILTLLITPLKRISSYLMTKYQLKYGKRLADWNWIIKLRRIFGLYSFYYACLHLAVYVWFDQGLEWEYIYEDILERPFIMVGVISFLILLIMAITSFKVLIKKLKKKWRKIHMSIYPLSILCLIHYWWLSKTIESELILYSILTFLLLLYRILVWTHIVRIRKDDTGMEVSTRHKVPLNHKVIF
ncbi:MAG: ferric reductase-like transmembrane domain-containing protein [Gammaproteobacteria bacterium]|nr:ferric reductase-like transmembrane domain-containing protein [Gammaproteobacteria bacterium]